MVNILICPDKFKGSLTAFEVCDAIENGLRKSSPKNLDIEKIPLADGGDGTFEILLKHFNARIIQTDVHDPLFRKISAEYAISSDGSTAFIEMAKASGLQLIEKEKRNPLYTTSLGTGELIKDAILRGAHRIILGIGGSATNDAGIGMASALGFEFFDLNKNPLKPIGENLIHLYDIQATSFKEKLNNIEVVVLSDVDNPLYGPTGAAYVYGPQKGATNLEVQRLNEGLIKFANVVKRVFGKQADFPGAGAAGGVGAGAKVFLNAAHTSGISYMVNLTQLMEKIRQADIIITGEGKVDSQSFYGKVVGEVSKLANASKKRLIICCGRSELSQAELQQHNIRELIALADGGVSEEYAMKNAFDLCVKKISSAGIIKN